MSGRGSVWATLTVLSVMVVACSPNTGESNSVPGTGSAARPDSTTVPVATTSAVEPVPGCRSGESAVPWREDATVELESILSGDGLEVFAAEYPLSGPTEGLWSQWGQGIALADGRHISAVGDQLGRNGNSWFFVYDPTTRRLTRFADVLSLVSQQPGAWGYGKVHAQMVADPCGSVWATTYWGTRRDLVYGNGYEGDRLIEIDPAAMTIADRGAIAPRRGIPTMTMAPDGTTLVGSAVEPESDTATLVVYDTTTRSTVTQVDDRRQIGFRSLGTESGGGVTFSIGGGRLAAYRPGEDAVEDLDLVLPGEWMRAITRPTEEGVIYGITEEEPVLFQLGPTSEVRPLGDPGGYTTSLAITPEGDRVFWLPNAHGGAWEVGAAIQTLDTATGEISDLVALEEAFEERLGLRAGGTYSMVYDQGRLILGVNASQLDDDSGFGTVVLVVVEGV